MSDLVAIALKITLGLFWKKARSSMSAKLKDGDWNCQKLRSLIVSNLEDVKTKLDGLARRDLLSSASFIQEGLSLLGDLLDKPNTSTLSPLTLVETINAIKLNSSDHFTSAMSSFTNANTKATEAFHNEALSVKDRILATKLRVQSRLLLSLENTSLATACKLYLEELHGLSAIVEMFRSDFKGGIWSLFNRDKQHELVLSVHAINLVVFKFLKSFTDGPVNLYNWPNVKHGDWTYNLLIPDETIYMELKNAGIEWPNLVAFKDIDLSMRGIDYELPVAVNSGGNLIVKSERNVLEITMNKVFRRRSRFFYTPGHDMSTSQARHMCLLAIDNDDYMYMLAEKFTKKPTPTLSMTASPCYLTALNSKGNQTRKFELGDKESIKLLIAIPNGFAVCICNVFSLVEFYTKNEGIISRSFSFKIKRELSLATVTDKHQLVTVDDSGYRVRIYEKPDVDGEFGQLMREFELHGGEREACVGITFNYLTKEVVVVSRLESDYFLSTYLPETCERRHKVRLSLFKKDEVAPRLTSHPSGHIALVTPEYVLYLQ